MKRDESLQELSRHHHHALVMALKLKRAGEREPIEEVKKALEAFRTHSNAHFIEEETVLIPALAEYENIRQIPEVIDMLMEHAEIRAAVNRLTEAQSAEAADFQALGRMFEQHVRKEEREIFPLIEKALPKEALIKIAPYFHEHP